MPNHLLVDPPVELREILARLRADGVPFDHAWDRAVTGRPGRRAPLVTYPHLTTARRWWKETFESQREEWRAAYDRKPSPLGDAAAELVRLLAEDVSGEARRASEDVGARMARVPIEPLSGFCSAAA